MDSEGIKYKIKEKGPAFLFGLMLGAVVIAAFVNRDKIAKAVDNTLNRNGDRDKTSVVHNEHT